tara:strand:+ start:6087 stop:8141 length:2055 start_codon:yes stop_codon:yes gene_type:complete
MTTIEKVIESHSSLPSSAVTVIDIPEPENVESEFFYNFFMRNEGQSSDGGSIFIDPATTEKYEKRFLEQRDDTPRFIRIRWEKPQMSKDTSSMRPGGLPFDIPQHSSDELSSLNSDVNIRDNKSSILFEEAMTNGSFSAVHLKDVNLDNKFYKLVSGTVERFSPEKLWAVITNDVGNNKFYAQTSFVNPDEPLNEKTTQALSHIKPEGYSHISREKQDLVNETFFGPKSLEVNFSLNNLFAGTVLRGSKEGSVGVFAEEIESLVGNASQAQEAAIKNVEPGTVSYDDYIHSITPIEVIGPIPPDDTQIGGAYDERSVLAGYYIEKTELLSDGRMVSYEPIIIENEESTSFLDSGVKYGAVYRYKVRAVALAQFEALEVASDGSKTSGCYVARCLIASRGVTIVTHCVDLVPPPPPDDIEFVYNYDLNNLMISWGFPVNTQQDIKKFQIFRRQSILQPFSLIAEYDFDDSMVKNPSGETVDARLVKKMRVGVTYYIDEEFDKKSSDSFKPVYAVCAIDAHGLSSNYSEQFQVGFDQFKNKIILSRVSAEGAPKPYPNLYVLEDLFEDAIKSSDNDRISVFFDPEYYTLYDEIGNDLNLIRIDQENPSYYMTVLNCDLQQSKIVELHVSNLEKKVAEEPIQSGRGTSIKTLPLDSVGHSKHEYSPTARTGVSSDWTDAFAELLGKP